MAHIAVISTSIRSGRASDRVALFLINYIEENNLGSTELVDLNEYKFPLFEERLKKQQNPTQMVLDFAETIRKADGVILVVPEYNGGYPASLKNIIDLLYDEWNKKPVAITTVSNGPFGGAQVLTSLVFVLWKMKAWVVPATFPVTFVTDTFDEEGKPSNKPETERRASNFLTELFWCIKARDAIS